MASSINILFQGFLLALGTLLVLMGVIVADKQARVRWGNWLLPDPRVPKVHNVRQVDKEPSSREQFRAVFPLPTDAGAEHSEFGSRAIRRLG